MVATDTVAKLYEKEIYIHHTNKDREECTITIEYDEWQTIGDYKK